ncbi:MAG: SRPBCC family protein [Phreatobacter sp.]
MTARRDTQGRQAALNLEFDLDAPPAKVWRAVTVPDFVERWLLVRPAGPEATVPGEQGAAPLPTQPASLRVLDQEPGQWVRYGWHDADHDRSDSVVTFRLDPNGAGGTRLRIAHVVAEAVAPPAGMAAANNNTPSLLLRAA